MKSAAKQSSAMIVNVSLRSDVDDSGYDTHRILDTHIQSLGLRFLCIRKRYGTKELNRLHIRILELGSMHKNVIALVFS